MVAETKQRRSLQERIGAWLFSERDIAALAGFRILFGLLLFAGVVRFWAEGWIATLLVEPSFQFKHWGFGWVTAWPGSGMYLHFAVLGLLALMIAAGAFYRFANIAFFVAFSYVEMIDVSTYLNHYYLVSLLSLLACFMPLHRAWSIDAWRRPQLRRATLPAWCTHLLRFQVGLVYAYAGLAKLGSDWLLYAQPLSIWMSARTDTPVVGSYLDEPVVAYAMAWAGFLYDSTIVLWLSVRRTRPVAYGILLVFHFFTGVFFNIGMFPFIMSVAALVFFSASWPRRLLRASWQRSLASHTEQPVTKVRGPRPLRGHPKPGAAPVLAWSRRRALAFALAVVWCALHVAVPLRHRLYGGQVLWHEQGMRWSWKVMVREKNGSVSYRVRLPDGREQLISPRRYLTRDQEREMSGQPDLILQLAHHIARDFRARGQGEVEVYVDALVSLNGRPPARLIERTVNLAAIEDTLAKAPWILPAPATKPILLRPISG